jgi:hypothetical protein
VYDLCSAIAICLPVPARSGQPGQAGLAQVVTQLATAPGVA